MALNVKIEKAKVEGKIWVFLFFYAMLLILFAIFFVILLLIGGYPVSKEYLKLYVDFIPLNMVLPFVIALTAVMSHRNCIMHITPANNLNIDRLKEFFITKNGFRVKEEREGFIKFEKTKFSSRLLWLNIDQPTIEVKNDEVLITLEKHTETIITPLLIFGKKYELNPEN